MSTSPAAGLLPVRLVLCLGPSEKKDKYPAQAIEFAPVYEFKKTRAKATKEPGIIPVVLYRSCRSGCVS